MINTATTWKRFQLGEDTFLRVFTSGCGGGVHCHFEVRLFVPEAEGSFILFESAYADSWKVRNWKWELEGQRLDAEEEAFFEYVDRLRGGESL